MLCNLFTSNPIFRSRGLISQRHKSWLLFVFPKKLQLQQQASNEDVCCTGRKLNEAPEGCRPFSSSRALAQLPESRWLLSVSVSASQHQPPAPLHSTCQPAPSHRIPPTVKAATTVEVTTAMISTNGEGCGSAQLVPYDR